MRYCPVASVTTERTFSIRAGLAASTLTPGRTAPELSLTTPVIAACAEAVDGKSRETRITRSAHEDRRTRFAMLSSLRAVQVDDASARENLERITSESGRLALSHSTCQANPKYVHRLSW